MHAVALRMTVFVGAPAVRARSVEPGATPHLYLVPTMVQAVGVVSCRVQGMAGGFQLAQARLAEVDFSTWQVFSIANNW